MGFLTDARAHRRGRRGRPPGPAGRRPPGRRRRSASSTTSTVCSTRSPSTRPASGPADRSPAGPAATAPFGDFLRALAARGARVAHPHRGFARHSRTREVQRTGRRAGRSATATASPRSAPTSPTVDADEQDAPPRRASRVPRPPLRARVRGRVRRARVRRQPRPRAAGRAIEFPGDVQPRGYTDEEVAGRDVTPTRVRRRRSSAPGRRARPRPRC